MREKIEDRRIFRWSEKEPLLEETKGRCAHCGDPLNRGENLTVEHFIPINKGGTNDPENLTVLCQDCNQLKSDMILPLSWYPYLSAEKKKIFRSLILKYLTDVDYLAENCLLMIDTFIIQVYIPIQRKLGSNGYKEMGMPVRVSITKMGGKEAFDWLINYKASLAWRDACGTITHPKEWSAPCYLLKRGDKEIAMVCPWMAHEWDKSVKKYRNNIMFDWYFSPNLPKKDYVPKMLADLMRGVESRVTHDLTNTMKGAIAITSRHRCFVSDRHCKAVYDELGRATRDIEFSTHYSKTARIRECIVFHTIGKDQQAMKKMQAELMEIYEKQGIKEMDDYVMTHCEELNNRLESIKGEKK